MLVVLLLALGVYWVLLHASHIRMREEVRINTQRLAGQTAHALALQMNTVVRKLEYFTEHLSWVWQKNDIKAFDEAARTAINALPAHALIHVAIADAQGQIIHSSFPQESTQDGAPAPISIADREHFTYHAGADGPRFFISHPIKARISQRSTIQFTRGIWENGQFQGIVTLAVSAEFLATSLEAIFPDRTDAASLIKSDGTYLTRSYLLDDVLGTTLPVDRPFIQHPEMNQGNYEVIAEPDNVRRLYSWKRVDDYPLIVLVGLGTDKAMALTNEAIRDSHWQSGFGSALLLLAGVTTALLWIQRSMRAAELQRVADALRASDHLRRALLDHSAAAIVLVNPQRRVVDANAQFASTFLKPGQRPQDLNLHDIHIDRAHWDQLGILYDKIRLEGSLRMDYPFKDVHGDIRWYDTHAVLQDPDNPESNVIWTWIDITSQHKADAALAIETLRLNTLLECFPGGVLIEDAHDTVVFVNSVWPELLRIELSPAELHGKHDSELRSMLGPTVASWLRSHRPHQSLESRRSHEVITDHGDYLEIDHVEILQDQRYLGSVWLIRDITRRKQHELELARLASTDTLTGLPNRRSFMESMNAAYRTVRNNPKTGNVVMILDIDRFKRVNDTYGHAIGDIVLQHIASQMKATLRDGDIPGRLGGEEFGVLLPYTSLPDGLKIAERIRHNIEQSHVCAGGHDIQVTISIGVSTMGKDRSPDVALKHADQALYTAKASGRNRVHAVHESETHIG